MSHFFHARYIKECRFSVWISFRYFLWILHVSQVGFHTTGCLKWGIGELLVLLNTLNNYTSKTKGMIL